MEKSLKTKADLMNSEKLIFPNDFSMTPYEHTSYLDTSIVLVMMTKGDET